MILLTFKLFCIFNSNENEDNCILSKNSLTELTACRKRHYDTKQFTREKTNLVEINSSNPLSRFMDM